MIFGPDRIELRRMYASAWQKRINGAALSGLEAEIAGVIEDHPEYQAAVTQDIDRDYTVESGETNPFLHMGLHLGIREQVATDRPAGIRAVYTRLLGEVGNRHGAEHRMIDCLAETLWEAQGQNRVPDEAAYLERLQRL